MAYRDIEGRIWPAGAKDLPKKLLDRMDKTCRKELKWYHIDDSQYRLSESYTDGITATIIYKAENGAEIQFYGIYYTKSGKILQRGMKF